MYYTFPSCMTTMIRCLHVYSFGVFVLHWAWNWVCINCRKILWMGLYSMTWCTNSHSNENREHTRNEMSL
ncbi:hypothetical protein BDV25DRAFT_148635 [Aspergillus avenaceus]|uniref:Uncharacterized protein n=1 Tax=Aspergillus avenaceus TaxID=36643 RepID=A0A5N6U5I0_ASPAV|nr:hypothetical protein BDV25DRAFT_148635 [Aspergillus avenaceus]